MKSKFGLLHEFYTGVLKLYPKTFQEEYAEELQSVFDLSVEDAAVKGGFEVERLILRKLVSLPMAMNSNIAKTIMATCQCPHDSYLGSPGTLSTRATSEMTAARLPVSCQWVNATYATRIRNVMYMYSSFPRTEVIPRTISLGYRLY